MTSTQNGGGCKGGGKGGKDGGQKGWDNNGGKAKGYMKGGGKGLADKDCYRCGQKGHIAVNCPKGGKGRVNILEEEESYEEETTTEEAEEVAPEWLGYIGKGNAEGGWLGYLNSFVDGQCQECAGSLNEFQQAKKAIKPKVSFNTEKGAHTQNRYEQLSNANQKEELNSIAGTWEPVSITIDSGAGNNVAPKTAFPWVPLQDNEDSRNGRFYTTANGKRV